MLSRIQRLLRNPRKIWLIVLAVFAVLQVAVLFRRSEKVQDKIRRPGTNDFMRICNLPNYDFWDPSVMQFVDYSYDPTKTCNRTFKPYTELVNGEWRIVEQREGMDCKARCIEANGVKMVSMGKWMLPGKTDCEFLEAVCWRGSEEVYGYIHTQIRPRKELENPKKEKAPNVFVVLFDAMDTGRAKRSLPKTLALLSKRFGSVEFPFVNRVGLNSVPNALALWFGKLIEAADHSPFGGENFEPDWTRDQHCYSYLDEKLSIFHDFNQEGYVTMNIDDYANQVTSWIDCKGFSGRAFDHDMHPFFQAIELNAEPVTKKHLNGHLCREKHHAAFDYFQQFVDAYKDGQPMFSWMWLSHISHDDFNGIIRSDKQLVELIKKNADVIDDSFFILMGDHGARLQYQTYQKTEIAKIERLNPYLSISIPKRFRSDLSIRATMRENAKRLQTHFDTRATLLDIAHFQPKESFRDRRLLEIPGEKGHSLLRKQPSTSRTCGTLPIPAEHCICQVEKIREANETLKQVCGQRVLDHIHEQLDDAGLGSLCTRFDLQRVTLLRRVANASDDSSRIQTFEITVKATAPSHAEFLTIVLKDGDAISVGGVARLDSYGNTGACVQNRNAKFESLCFCKRGLF